MEDRECIVFEGDGAVGFPKRRFNCAMLVRIVMVLAVVAIVSFFAFGAILEKDFGEYVEGGATEPHETGGGAEDFLGDSETVGSESITETEEETEKGFWDDETLDRESASVDLSRSEMGDCFAYNYTDKLIDFEGLLAKSFSGAKYSFSDEPLVMIVHSRSRQGYSDFVEDDPLCVAERGVVAVGAVLTERLNDVGISAVHVTVMHDLDGADPYEEMRKTLETMLEIYPTVEYVIDLGNFEARDDSGRGVRTVSGVGCAQMRLTVSVEGSRWKDDLSMALKLRKYLNADEKKVCLPVTVTESGYGSGESLYYLKVDIGTSANSSHEAFYAAELFAEAFEGLVKIYKSR